MSVFTLSICAKDGIAQAVSSEPQSLSYSVGGFEIPQEIIEFFEEIEINTIARIIFWVILAICAFVAIIVVAIILVIVIIIILVIVVEVIVPILTIISAGLAPLFVTGGLIELILLIFGAPLATELIEFIMEWLRMLVG